MTIDLLRPAKITRTADHVYSFEGKQYPSVTTILKVVDKSGPLMAWAARETAEAALGMMTGEDPMYWPLASLQKTVGDKGVVKALTERSTWKRDEAANLGTLVHGYADDYIRTGAVTTFGPAQKHVERYAEWWQAAGWTVRASEAMLVNPEAGYGGTLDLLCYDRDGRTVLADIKTGAKGVYREAILQLTAYGEATWIETSQGLFRMPKVDRYAILHVTADNDVREIPVDVGSLEKVAFFACCDLHQWMQTVKGKL